MDTDRTLIGHKNELPNLFSRDILNQSHTFTTMLNSNKVMADLHCIYCYIANCWVFKYLNKNYTHMNETPPKCPPIHTYNLIRISSTREAIKKTINRKMSRLQCEIFF